MKFQNTNQEDIPDDDNYTVVSNFTPPECIAGDVQYFHVEKTELDNHLTTTSELKTPESLVGDIKSIKNIKANTSNPTLADGNYKGVMSFLLMLLCIIMMFPGMIYANCEIGCGTSPTLSTLPTHITETTLSIPIPGHIYLIRSASTGGLVISINDQHVSLGSRAAWVGDPQNSWQQWMVVQNKGWLGLKNIESGKFLGHDRSGNLRCAANHQREWEKFHFKADPQGGHFLVMTHYDDRVPVGFKSGHGKRKLGKLVRGGFGSEVLLWEFIKVER